jgi:hypothetical protein
MCLADRWVSRGSVTSGNSPEHRRKRGPGHGSARWAERTCALRPPGTFQGFRYYLIQACTFSRLASTHFFAAASGAILSTAMYLATVFWSSFVQVKFFTRS